MSTKALMIRRSDWGHLVMTVAGSVIAPGMLLGVVAATMGFAAAWSLFDLLVLVYFWVLFAFLYYRQLRQDEFLHLLATAVEANIPLAPTLWAYLHDRPRGPMRELWLAALLLPVVPAYYLFWHLRNRHDLKVRDVAHLLGHGFSLHQALTARPGTASRETLLAVAMGEVTGRPALTLSRAVHSPLRGLWAEVLPRFLYPLVLLLFITGISTFWMDFIRPRLERIFFEFGIELPDLTVQLFAFWDWSDGLIVALGFGFQALVGLVVLLAWSPWARWHIPGFGRFYRMYIRGRVLQMLGLLLDAGKPVPQALGLLIDSGYFPRVVTRRLEAVRRLVEHGEPLADSMNREGLLPASMVPLVHAAQRMQNLPWALAELGESLANRTARLLRRVSLLVTPALVFVIGLLVGFVTIGMFLPVIKIIEGMI